ncbi:MAG: NAD(P)(+) transhydrogenase (Re/Si-specific) subunit beta [Treponema sp.]|nr:NAD(P)(+) transhydrogenase (Re/Si-specific) subunit beta [Treponema sp.]
MIGNSFYLAAGGLLAIGILAGIALMGKVRTAAMGNRLSALCVAAAVLLTLLRFNILNIYLYLIIIPLAAGIIFSFFWAKKIKMITMPQSIAMLNGFGGAASALVGAVTLLGAAETDPFVRITCGLAITVGMSTLTGSLIAAGKLAGILKQKPVVWKAHQLITTALMVLSLVFSWLAMYTGFNSLAVVIICAAVSGLFGIAFAVRIGGADMPITISLLNSLSGVAGSAAGMAIGDPLLVAAGGIVGASGLLLTQIMCRAMNRSLADIVLGRTTVNGRPAVSAVSAMSAMSAVSAAAANDTAANDVPVETSIGMSIDTSADTSIHESANTAQLNPAEILNQAKRVIIIPGYGMALAQAQMAVKRLADKLETKNVNVDFAIHPVAGRMPGHMNVLLAEADVPYEKLREMDEINPEFADCDIAIIIGANDVVNPAARNAKGTPIYGMPVLRADRAKHVIICNFDLKPGYSGVENSLYKNPNTILMLGDAAQTVEELITLLG